MYTYKLCVAKKIKFNKYVYRILSKNINQRRELGNVINTFRNIELIVLYRVCVIIYLM